jgi:hypothetical protein
MTAAVRRAAHPSDDQLLTVMTAPPGTGSLEALQRFGSADAT